MRFRRRRFGRSRPGRRVFGGRRRFGSRGRRGFGGRRPLVRRIGYRL